MHSAIMAWFCLVGMLLAGNTLAGVAAILVRQLFPDFDDGILPGLVVGLTALGAGLGSLWLMGRLLSRGLGRGKD